MKFPIKDIIMAFLPVIVGFLSFFLANLLFGNRAFRQETLVFWLIFMSGFEMVFNDFYNGICFFIALIIVWLLTMKNNRKIGAYGD